MVGKVVSFDFEVEDLHPDTAKEFELQLQADIFDEALGLVELQTYDQEFGGDGDAEDILDYHSLLILENSNLYPEVTDGSFSTSEAGRPFYPQTIANPAHSQQQHVAMSAAPYQKHNNIAPTRARSTRATRNKKPQQQKPLYYQGNQVGSMILARPLCYGQAALPYPANDQQSQSNSQVASNSNAFATPFSEFDPALDQQLLGCGIHYPVVQGPQRTQHGFAALPEEFMKGVVTARNTETDIADYTSTYNAASMDNATSTPGPKQQPQASVISFPSAVDLPGLALAPPPMIDSFHVTPSKPVMSRNEGTEDEGRPTTPEDMDSHLDQLPPPSRVKWRFPYTTLTQEELEALGLDKASIKKNYETSTPKKKRQRASRRTTPLMQVSAQTQFLASSPQTGYGASPSFNSASSMIGGPVRPSGFEDASSRAITPGYELMNTPAATLANTTSPGFEGWLANSEPATKRARLE